MNDVDALSNVRAHLREWQHEKGGWITDLTPNLELVGVANIEITALAVLSLVE